MEAFNDGKIAVGTKPSQSPFDLCCDSRSDISDHTTDAEAYLKKLLQICDACSAIVILG